MSSPPKTVVREILRPKRGKPLPRPLFTSKVPAGFPSPADDHVEKNLDLNEHLVRHPASTFFVRVQGSSMVGAGIHDGDILVVDRALQPAHNKIVIAILDGELTVKRLKIRQGKITLVSENPAFKSREVSSEDQFEVWGVVTNVIHPV